MLSQVYLKIGIRPGVLCTMRVWKNKPITIADAKPDDYNLQKSQSQTIISRLGRPMKTTWTNSWTYLVNLCIDLSLLSASVSLLFFSLNVFLPSVSSFFVDQKKQHAIGSGRCLRISGAVFRIARRRLERRRSSQTGRSEFHSCPRWSGGTAWQKENRRPETVRGHFEFAHRGSVQLYVQLGDGGGVGCSGSSGDGIRQPTNGRCCAGCKVVRDKVRVSWSEQNQWCCFLGDYT